MRPQPVLHSLLGIYIMMLRSILLSKTGINWRASRIELASPPEEVSQEAAAKEKKAFTKTVKIM